MIRKKKINKRKSSKRTRNPSGFQPSVLQQIILTDVEPKGKGYGIEVKLLGDDKPLYTKGGFKDRLQAGIAAEAAEDAIITILASKKNPVNVSNIPTGIVAKSLGLPERKEDAYELGRLAGIQTALQHYCGIKNIITRIGVKKQIDKEIADALSLLNETVKLRAAGFEGPTPFIKKGTNVPKGS